MTDATILVSQNMIDCVYFSSGQSTVMTRLAVIHNANMIKRSRDKARGLMAHTAIIIRWHMPGGFSCCSIAIVTGSTVIHDASVIKSGTGKGLGVVAQAAILSCHNVAGISLGGLSDRVSTIVTGIATSISGHVTMVEHGGRPGAASDMTDFAVITICRTMRAACCIGAR